MSSARVLSTMEEDTRLMGESPDGTTANLKETGTAGKGSKYKEALLKIRGFSSGGEPNLESS